METDLKYNIPQGVFGTNGGCVKGSVAQGSSGPYCNPSAMLSGTRADGSFGSLAACCAEVESRTRVDPRNGRPMPQQANVKAACLAYKKPAAAGGAAGGAAPAPAAVAPTDDSDQLGKPCFAVEVEKEGQVLGVWATYGGCIKGKIAYWQSFRGQAKGCEATDPLWGGNRVDRPAYHSSLENCCREVESRSGHKGVKESCLAYKKPVNPKP